MINDPYYAGPAYDEPSPAELQSQENWRANNTAEAIIKLEMRRALYRINARLNRETPDVLWDGSFTMRRFDFRTEQRYRDRVEPHDVIDALTECLSDYIEHLPEDVDD